MKETNVKALIRLEAAKIPGLRLFNSPNGSAWQGEHIGVQRVEGETLTILRNARLITFGLVEGSSDLIGWFTKCGVARFVALEVKTERGRASAEQRRFIAAVTAAGGIAGVIRSPGELAGFFEGEV